MIANFFKKSRPIGVLTNLIIAFVFFVVSIVNKEGLHLEINFVLQHFLLLLLLLIWLFMFSFIVSKNNLTKDNLYAMFLGVLYLGVFSNFFSSPKIILAQVFLFFGLRKIFSLKSEINTKGKLFDAALWISVASLFYAEVSFYFLLIYVAIFVFNKVNLRNLIIPVLGILIPWFLFYTYLFVINNQWSFNFQFQTVSSNELSIFTNLSVGIPLILTGILILIAVFKVSSKIASSNPIKKQNWLLLLSLMLLSIIVSLFSTENTSASFVYIIFPASVVVANLIELIKANWLKNILLLIFCLVSVGVYFL
ncbi:MAG: DUF6427 family protein [Lutibacter sp.]